MGAWPRRSARARALRGKGFSDLVRENFMTAFILPVLVVANGPIIVGET